MLIAELQTCYISVFSVYNKILSASEEISWCYKKHLNFASLLYTIVFRVSFESNTSRNHACTIKYFPCISHIMILAYGHLRKNVCFEKTFSDFKNQTVFVIFGQNEKNLKFYFILEDWNSNKYRLMTLSLYIVTCRVSQRVCKVLSLLMHFLISPDNINILRDTLWL